MAWVIKNKLTNLYYRGKIGRWSKTPKIYAKEGWAKAAMTMLKQYHSWNKSFDISNLEIVEHNTVPKFTIYFWRDRENCALFINGQYKATYLHDHMRVTEVYDFVPEGTPVKFEFFDLPEDDDKEIYFDKDYCEDEGVYKEWMETH